MNLPCFIDFEASSLQVDSYPTEVAWSTPEGVIESHLINPCSVEEWTDWDPGAQAITGISRKLLREQGRPPAWVCERMNEVLAGRTLYSDAVLFDGFWLGVLFEQSECGPPTFGMGDLFLMVERRTGLPRERVLHCLEAGRVEVGKAHRAAWDVEAHLAGWRLAACRGGM